MKLITTTTHAMAIGLYVLMVIIGATWATGVASLRSATELYGPQAHVIIGLPVTIAALVGGLAALTSQFFVRPDGVLRVEAACCLVVAAGFGMYWWSIFGKAATTELLAFGLIVVCVARVVQVWVELRRIR